MFDPTGDVARLMALRESLRDLGARPVVFFGPMGNDDVKALLTFEEARYRRLLKLMGEQVGL